MEQERSKFVSEFNNAALDFLENRQKNKNALSSHRLELRYVADRCIGLVCGDFDIVQLRIDAQQNKILLNQYLEEDGRIELSQRRFEEISEAFKFFDLRLENYVNIFVSNESALRALGVI